MAVALNIDNVPIDGSCGIVVAWHFLRLYILWTNMLIKPPSDPLQFAVLRCLFFVIHRIIMSDDCNQAVLEDLVGKAFFKYQNLGGGDRDLYSTIYTHHTLGKNFEVFSTVVQSYLNQYSYFVFFFCLSWLSLSFLPLCI